MKEKHNKELDKLEKDLRLHLTAYQTSPDGCIDNGPRLNEALIARADYEQFKAQCVRIAESYFTVSKHMIGLSQWSGGGCSESPQHDFCRTWSSSI